MIDKYPHLFFDLDRTLWDFEENSKAALIELFDKYDIASISDKSFDTFYKTYKSTNAFYWRQYQNGNIKKEQLRSIRFIKTLESISIKDITMGMKMGQDYIDISPYQTILFPNTISTLKRLKHNGHKMHIITNGFNEVQYIKLEKSGIREFFDIIVTSDEFGKSKPHPSIFKHALSQAKANIKDSLMIGDSIGSDLEGAKGIGMDHVFFNPNRVAHDHIFTYEINDLIELIDLNPITN